MNEPTALLQFLGRLHPLVLHLPIGLWIGIVALEFGGAMVRRAPGRATLAILAWIAALGGAFAAGSGWLLSQEPYTGQTLELHRWLGVAAAAIGLIAASFAAMQTRGPFRLMLVVEFVVLMAAGHLGSELTRGSEWLFEPFESTPTATTSGTTDKPATANTFATAIEPLLQRYCTQCHGDKKQKGELALHTQALLLLGGENGPVLQPGNPLESPLYAQLLLPVTEDLHMPPDGKKQPTPEEIALIGSWIAAGAPFAASFESTAMPTVAAKPQLETQKATTPSIEPGSTTNVPQQQPTHDPALPPESAPVSPAPISPAPVGPVPVSPSPEPVSPPKSNPQPPGAGLSSDAAPTLLAVTPNPDPTTAGAAAVPEVEPAPARVAAPARAAALSALHKRQVHATGIAEGDDALWVDFGPIAASTTEDEVRTLLIPVANHVQDLGLSRVPVSESTFVLCATMPQLQRLDLRSTKATTAMLRPLAGAPKLRELVLADTRLDDGAVDVLLAMPSLRTVYLWNAGVSDAAIARLRRREELSVDNGSGGNPTTTATTTKAAALQPQNTVCPVSGKPTDSRYVIVHEQHVVGFCCPNCPKTFWAEPSKFPVADR